MARRVSPTIVCLTLLALLCLAKAAGALPEAELATAYADQVRPFWNSQFSFGELATKDGLRLRYAKRIVPQAKASLVLVAGRTEFMAKYAELLYDLRELPISVYLYDQRGQGLSSRLLPEHDKGHVADFEEYVDDLGLVVDRIVRPEGSGPILLLGHSMGALVAGLYADRHPQAVAGLILSSPMLAINSRPFPDWLARGLARTAVAVGAASHYVPGGRPYEPAKKPFAGNDVTGSEARFSLNRQLVREAPANALGSPTFGWVRQAFMAMDRLQAEHRHLTMPVLLLQAEADTVVRNKPENELCRALPNCTLASLPGARHEILMERDAIRDEALGLIRNFIRQGMARAAGEARP